MRLAVIGSGGHSRPVVSAAMQSGRWRQIVVLDPSYNGKEERILGVAEVKSLEVITEFSSESTEIFFAVGRNSDRKALSANAIFAGFDTPNLIHPSAIVSEYATMGRGNYVGAFAHIGPGATIGDMNIVNTGANIEHEAFVGSFCQIAPRAVICGRARLGNMIFVGAGGVVIERLCIAENTIIGAGAVIVKSIAEAHGVYVGVPGRTL
jgi:UDP-N-acetylbacillosamine N-acetyltransferase